MSDPRGAIKTITITDILPDMRGKIFVKIELFPMALFENAYNPTIKKFYPAVPVLLHERREYWKGGRMRVRINGKWHQDRARYDFLTLGEVLTLIQKTGGL